MNEEHGAVDWTSPCPLSASLSAWETSGASRTCATEEAEVSETAAAAAGPTDDNVISASTWQRNSSPAEFQIQGLWFWLGHFQNDQTIYISIIMQIRGQQAQNG